MKKQDETIQISDVVQEKKSYLIDMEEYRSLKRDLQVPKTLMPIITGLLGGISGSVMRGFTVCFSEKDGMFAVQTIVFFCIMAFFMCFQLRCLNKSMHLYDQIEIVPIY